MKRDINFVKCLGKDYFSFFFYRRNGSDEEITEYFIEVLLCFVCSVKYLKDLKNILERTKVYKTIFYSKYLQNSFSRNPISQRCNPH